MTFGALILGALWLAGFLALTALRVVRLNPQFEGPWTWPVWIAIASPLAAALAPLWVFLLVASLYLGHTMFALLVFGPLLATALAGTIGVIASIVGPKRT